MPVETRSSESAVTKNLQATLASIAAQRQTLLQEEQQLEHLKTQYEAKRKALEAEAEQKKSELAAARRRQEEQVEHARRRMEESSRTSSAAATARLVKMVGKASICTRCAALKVDCYRAPRRLRQKLDNAPGFLKDFIRCQNCIKSGVPCRTPIRTSSNSDTTASTGTSASPTIAPSRSVSGVAAGMKRKDDIVSMTSSDEDEDAHSDAPPAPSAFAAKRRKIDVLVPPQSPPRARGKHGQFLPTEKTKYKSTAPRSCSGHLPGPSTSMNTQSDTILPPAPSASGSSSGVASEETLKSILDTMNRNHQATMKLFTRLLGNATPPGHTTDPSAQSSSTPLVRGAPFGVSSSGSGSGSGIRPKTPKPLGQTHGRIPKPNLKKNANSNKRKVMVKVEEQEQEEDGEEVDQLINDREPEVIEIEDSDDAQ